MIRTLTLLFLFLTVISCSKTVAGGNGSGSEVTNGFTIGITTADGSPSKAIVKVRPRFWYPQGATDTLSDTIRNSTTDASGKVIIEGLRPGQYRLSIFDESGLSTLFDGNLPTGDAVDFGFVKVELPGSIEGAIDLSASADSLSVVVQLEGTDLTSPVDTNGFYSFDSVPSGIHRVRILTSEESATPVESEIIELVSGESASIDTLVPLPGGFDPSNWLYQKSWTLNTSNSGELITGDSLPLLLRITPEMADLSGASSNGADLRVTDSDGSEIPFELISWDQTSASLSLIQRDITANQMKDITVHWGNSKVQSASNPAALNDTATGTVIALHAEEEGALARKDVSLYGNHSDISLQNSDRVPLSAPGVIGNSILFDGVDDHLIIPSSPSISLLNEFTIAFWTKFTRRSDGKNSRFLSKESDYEVKENNGKLQFSAGNAYILSHDSLSIDEWNFITISINLAGATPEITLYRNTTEMVIQDNTFPTAYDFSKRVTENPLYLGTLGGEVQYSLNGQIDEFRIWNRQLTLEEITARFNSEKSGSMLFQ